MLNCTVYKRNEKLKMNKYICNVCATVYYPERGDSESGIPSGTPFEDLPDTWTCPICGSAKERFAIFNQENRQDNIPKI